MNTFVVWLLITGVLIVLGLLLTYLRGEKETKPGTYTDFESFYNALLTHGNYSRCEAEALYAVWQRKDEMVEV